MNKRNHKLETEVIHAGYEAGGLYLLGRRLKTGLPDGAGILLLQSMIPKTFVASFHSLRC
ncbi:hypothetical protein [Virgibacillus chiguensis]|uniref:Uncharacterized protein n=1 Tax=Virgibacillus chiguensis TaxID=411959 RepID=A0A1M5RBL2_9BACI|nr:hypothetical protein [Virgibacillus chiguensis]SHH23747.1 hypothetical protein SAMN05421807_10596 [Virgibacillus chiguensis]